MRGTLITHNTTLCTCLLDKLSLCTTTTIYSFKLIINSSKQSIKHTTANQWEPISIDDVSLELYKDSPIPWYASLSSSST